MSYGHLGRRVDAELQLRLLVVGEGLALNEEGGATVGELPDVIEDKVDVIRGATSFLAASKPDFKYFK